MNKKILIVSIIAVVILVFASFTGLVGIKPHQMPLQKQKMMEWI